MVPRAGRGTKEIQMDSNDQPVQPAEAQAIEAPPVEPATRQTGFRRTVLTAGMAAALLMLGGVAAVSAASPDPSAGPTPAAATDPSNHG
jgi:hypothetical protein